MDARLNSFVLDRDGAQIYAFLHDPPLELGRPALHPIVECEGADHTAVAGLDRGRPAGQQAKRQCQRPVFLPQRVRCDIDDFDRLSAPGGRSAGTRARPCRLAFERLRKMVGQARRSERSQGALRIHGQYRADHIRRQAFDVKANTLRNHVERFTAHNRLENPIVQGLQGFAGAGFDHSGSCNVSIRRRPDPCAKHTARNAAAHSAC